MRRIHIVFVLFGLITGHSNSFKLQTRILNGISSSRGQFPFFAHLFIVSADDVEKCGGSLITAEWIITAAHCLEDFEYVDVSLGFLHNGPYWRKDRLEFYITKSDVHLHPDYRSDSIFHDIALVHLPEPATFSPTIQPIKLSNVVLPEVADVIVIGNSAIENSAVQYTPMTTCSSEECLQIFPMLENSKSIFCARNSDGRSIASGDSGSPVLKDDGTLVAISSFIRDDYKNNTPQGFTKVFAYHKWINRVVGYNLIY